MSISTDTLQQNSDDTAYPDDQVQAKVNMIQQAPLGLPGVGGHPLLCLGPLHSPPVIHLNPCITQSPTEVAESACSNTCTTWEWVHAALRFVLIVGPAGCLTQVRHSKQETQD